MHLWPTYSIRVMHMCTARVYIRVYMSPDGGVNTRVRAGMDVQVDTYVCGYV